MYLISTIKPKRHEQIKIIVKHNVPKKLVHFSVNYEPNIRQNTWTTKYLSKQRIFMCAATQKILCYYTEEVRSSSHKTKSYRDIFFQISWNFSTNITFFIAKSKKPIVSRKTFDCVVYFVHNYQALGESKWISFFF